MLKAKKVNGFNFIEGNFVRDLENDNEQGLGLHLENCEIESYDEDGVYFTPEQNAEVYIKNFDGSIETIEIEK